MKENQISAIKAAVRRRREIMGSIKVNKYFAQTVDIHLKPIDLITIYCNLVHTPESLCSGLFFTSDKVIVDKYVLERFITYCTYSGIYYDFSGRPLQQIIKDVDLKK